MSADSPRLSGSRVTRQSGAPASCHGSGQVVLPQPVTDPSIIDSVTGFINDVVPQAYTSTLPGDCKETITWARFESADINDPCLYPDGPDTTLPLLLVLGYNTGVQVWSIPANGEATEVLSWSQGCVRTLRILPSPASNSMRKPDTYALKRPLVALCDSAGPGPGPPFCSVSFISLLTGDHVKSIKFKNPVCDVLANRRSIVVTFLERIAVFDACTLEDRLSITCCYPSPGPNPNPVSIGSRWLAFAEKKLVAWQRSSGGVGGSGAQSYTAAVLHAAQTLGRGLRGLSETVASSLTGPRHHGGSGSASLGSSPPTMNGADHNTPGVVTVLDLEGSCNRHNATDEGGSSASFSSTSEGVVAHFLAHSEAIVALQFDPSGMLLLTADRRGHNFNVFRLQPHPAGSSLAAVHHMYVLHRGDTSAKVQDVSFSCDSRWVAVSTLRGTTHVFPLTPYGGPVGFRTHGSPHVVNRLSRFHRSAGLSADGRSSPVPSPEAPPCLPAGPHANPRLPPYPHATVQAPLSQLRQSPHPPLGPAGSLDVSLKVCAAFASPRTWLLDSHAAHPRDGPRDATRALRRAVDSLFVMAGHGNLVQYDLEPVPLVAGSREKVCDDTQIDLEVEARAQWPLQRSSHSAEVLPPLPSNNSLLCGPDVRIPSNDTSSIQNDEHWLSQVEIITHAGPHRRLWMGPQITFKTYTTNVGSNIPLLEVEAVEVGTVPVSRPARSNPVNMPHGGRPLVPVLIESGSGSSLEQSPHFVEVYGADSGDTESWSGQGDSRLREDLADAMLESPGAPSREKGKRRYYGLVGGGGGTGEGEGEGRVVRGGCGPVRRVVNPGGAEITMSSDGEASDMEQQDLAEHLWEAIAIPATAPVIPLPAPPASDCSSSGLREMVTRIPATELRSCAGRQKQQPPARGGKSCVDGSEDNVAVARSESDVISEPRDEEGSPGARRGSVTSPGAEVVSRQKGRRTAEVAEPPPVCKKSKKNTSTQEREHVGRKLSGEDPIPGEAGRKGKKVTQEKDCAEAPDVALRKSSSPQNDALDSKGGKRPSGKDQNDDSSSLVSKKNKKKASILLKDGSRKFEGDPECLEIEVEQTRKKTPFVEAEKAFVKLSRRNSRGEKQSGISISQNDAVLKKSIEELPINDSNDDEKETISLGSTPPDLSRSAGRGGSKKKANQEKIVDMFVESREIKDDSPAREVAQPSTKGMRRWENRVQSYEENGSIVLQSERDGSVEKIVASTLNINICNESINSSESVNPVNFACINSNFSNEYSLSEVTMSKIAKDLEEAADDFLEPDFCNKKRDKICSDGHKKVSSIGHGSSSEVAETSSTRCLESSCAATDENTTLELSNSISNVWKAMKSTELGEDLVNYPELSNKKAWMLSSNETTCTPIEKVPPAVSKKPKKSTVACEISSRCESIQNESKGCIGDEVIKTKVGSTLGSSTSENNINSIDPVVNVNTDIDVNKLSFEDLEAIYDAVCKEEEISYEKTCLKENKKGKKSESGNVALCSKKSKGKENVEEEVSVDTKVIDKPEVIDPPKAVEEAIKQDDSAKSPEKPATTPVKTSRSQRRKRR